MPLAYIPLLLLLAAALDTRSEAFEDRVALGKQAETEPDVASYQAKWVGVVGQSLASAMRECTTGKDERDLGPFTLVADISPAGRAEGIAVQPVTPVAACFSKAFNLLIFPTPPPFHDRAGFPVAIEMKITE